MTGTYIAHHGIKGQKWGVRNYQNSDGSYTAAGRARYGIGSTNSPVSKKAGSANQILTAKGNRGDIKEKKGLSDKAKKALKIGAAVTATALVAYGAYRLSKNPQVAEEFAKAKSSISKAVSEAKNKTKQDLSSNNKKNNQLDKILDGVHADYKTAHDSKPIEKMSTQELKTVVERRNLENQYRQQSAPKDESLYKKVRK